MPELDILHGAEYLVGREQAQHLKQHGTPLQGYLQLWPRVFVHGTKEKKWWTSCVTHVLGSATTVGIEDSDYIAHKHNLHRCEGKKGSMWRPFYERRLETGPLFAVTRGKELAFAAGKYLVKAHFGLEGNLLCVRRDYYERIVASDCPSANSSKSKAGLMRSFIIPEDLTIPEARMKGTPQRIEIFAAIVCEHRVFLFVDFSRMIWLDIFALDREWIREDLQPDSMLATAIWDAKHGPDWIKERLAAETALDGWCSTTLQNTDVSAEGPLVEEMCENQAVFNGYGRHTAHDLLHQLHVWPGTPPSVVCQDDTLYARFKLLLHEYASQFVSQQYRMDCLGIPNIDSPFAFNYKSDDNYLGKYVLVYRKWKVNVPREEWNELYRHGLLDPEHMIGNPYAYDPEKLLGEDRSFVRVTVRMHQGIKKPWYSIIQAKRPGQWKYERPGPGKVSDDVRHASMATTLGPASFYYFKQNQYDPEKPGQCGRPKTYRTGMRGRPATAPTKRKLVARANRDKAARDRMIAAESQNYHDEDNGSSGVDEYSYEEVRADADMCKRLRLDEEGRSRRITRSMIAGAV